MALIGEMHYLTIGENTYSIPTSGGSTVTIQRALTSGTKSATISVDGTSYDLYAPTPNAGTVTSVRVQATSPVQSSTSTAQSSTLNTTISLVNGYGDTKNPYGTKTANYVLAGPTTGSAAAPSFRALVAADIPDLSETYLTSYTETDPVFSASAASGITSTDISNWNAKVSDTGKWNNVSLTRSNVDTGGADILIPYVLSTSATEAKLVTAGDGNIAKTVAIRDANGYIRANTPSANDNSTKVATTAYVDSAIDTLPEPMIFKGSLGTGGTITSLPTAAASNEGYTYKVITAGTYASQSAKVGDTFISDGSAWVLIPSGDEPSGTVTSITLTQGTGITVSNSGTAITTSGSRTISLASITKDDTTSTASPSHGGTFTAIDSITYDTYGRVTGVNTKTVTLPADSNTDTKLQVAAVTSGTTYYPIVGTGTTAATRQYDTTGFIYVGTNGTANGTNGNALLTLGNSTASTTANWKKGTVRLYGTTAYYTDLVSGAPSANRTITFPNATGTVALTSQIPTVPSSTESATTGITIAAHGTTSIGSASNWSAGTASTWAFEEISIPNVTAAGSASTWAFEEKTIPNVTSAGTASSWTFEEKTIPNVTAAGSGSFTATVSNHVLSFSHTHTAPTIGTAIKVQSKSGGSNGTAPTLGTVIKVQSKSSGSNGTAPTIGTAIKVQSKKSGVNSTVPSLTITSTTVTTGTTHSITDPGHTHTL